MNRKKTILVAPLHWGLGHATRCIPIIKGLLKNGYDVLLASDGGALLLLQKEFPELPYISLPSYNITYPKKGAFFKLKILLKTPYIQKIIASERRIIEKLVAEDKIQGIISDNRWGVRSKKIPSVIITHQLNVLSGNTSFISSKMHQNLLRKFDACWVPDLEGSINLSGKLGHFKDLLSAPFPVTYIGLLSRMQKKELAIEYDVLCLLSGPEPQRTALEEKFISVFKHSKKKVLLIQGIVEEEKIERQKGAIQVINFLKSSELETAINKSACVVSRSGYTTIMDLAAMEKKAFFIPTPGQFEQVYLAKRLKKAGFVPSCKQHTFEEDKLGKISLYKGLQDFNSKPDFENLFRFFERK